MNKWKEYKEIPEGVKIREGRVNLFFSPHSKERFLERIGNDVLPSWVVIQKKNIEKIFLDEDGEVQSITLRLNYSHNKNYLFLGISPRGYVYTLWVDKIKRYEYNKQKREAIEAEGRMVPSSGI